MCQKNSCRLITVILASVHFSLFVPVSSNPANAESDFGMLRNTFKAVSSKHELEELIKTEITSYYYENGQVDWDCLIQGFRAMGDEFKVVIIPNAGFEKADVIRFSVDNLSILSELTGVPGASNGVFTAVINRATESKAAIVRRGGELEWLRLE